MYDYLKKLITPDMVSFWVPNGPTTCIDLRGQNHGQCYGTHPNVPVISTFQPPNLVTDGGLNTWTTATDLTNWLETLSGSSTIHREATEKIEGDYSCRLDVDASNNVVFIQQPGIPLIPNKRYKLIIWYKNSVVGKNAYFQFRDDVGNVFIKTDGTWNVGSNWINFPNSTVWIPFELEFSAHADYSSYLIILRRGSVSASSSIYFDNVSIEELKPSVINPSVGWYFDRTDDYVLFPDNASLRIAGDFATGAYIKPGIWTTERAIISKYLGYGAPQIVLAMHSSQRPYLRINDDVDSSTNIMGSTALSDDWFRVIATRHEGKLYLYLNGVSDKTPVTDVSGNISSTRQFGLGKHSAGWGYPFGGYIALPFITNKGWSQAQVTNDWLNTRSLFAPRG